MHSILYPINSLMITAISEEFKEGIRKMDKALALGDLTKGKLSETYELVMVDIGLDSDVKRRGTELKTSVYKVGDIGHDGEYVTNEQMNDKKFLKLVKG